MDASAIPIKELQKGCPGDRFQRLYRRRQDSAHGGAKNAAFIAMGMLTIGLGILSYPIPIVPSDLVILVGVALLSQGSLKGARAVDWLEVRFRRRFSGEVKAWKRLSRPAQLALGFTWSAIVTSLFYGAYRLTVFAFSVAG